MSSRDFIPAKEQAEQFALMLQSGMPSHTAIRYFFEPDDPILDDLELMKKYETSWLRSRAFKEAQTALMGAPWHKMAVKEKIAYAVEKSYVEMAFFLFQHNYNDLKGEMKQKADTCRMALEAKIAGTAGASTPMSRFYEDMLKAIGEEKKAKFGAPIRVGLA